MADPPTVLLPPSPAGSPGTEPRSALLALLTSFAASGWESSASSTTTTPPLPGDQSGAAAVAPPSPVVAKKVQPVHEKRKGKWTAAEEEYSARLIHYFKGGLLPLPDGTTLRNFLSEKLDCDPMRISKKFTGAASVGKRVFHPCERTAATIPQLEAAQKELDELEQRFRERLDRSPERGRSSQKSFSPAARNSGSSSSSNSLSSTENEGRHVNSRAVSTSSPPALSHHDDDLSYKPTALRVGISEGATPSRPHGPSSPSPSSPPTKYPLPAGEVTRAPPSASIDRWQQRKGKIGPPFVISKGEKRKREEDDQDELVFDSIRV